MSRAVAVMLACLALGCSFDQKLPEKSRFIVVVEFEGEKLPANDRGILRVHRFRASPVFERSGFVSRTGRDSFVEDFYNEFYLPPGPMVREVSTRYLRESGLFELVLEPNDSRSADWLIEGRVENLYADFQDKSRPLAVLSVEISVIDEGTPDLPVVFNRTYHEEEVVDGTGAKEYLTALNACMRRFLERLSADLGEQIVGKDAS